MLAVVERAEAACSVRDEDDGVVACVLWRGGRVLRERMPDVADDRRVDCWMDLAAHLVGPDDPWRVLTRAVYGQLRRGQPDYARLAAALRL